MAKPASSTMSGVALRIGHRHFNNQSSVPKMTFCGTAWYHTKARKHQILKRNKTTSFVWTVVREPTNRVISSFYFHHRRNPSSFFSYKTFKIYVNDRVKKEDLFKDIDFIAPTKEIAKVPYSGKKYDEFDWNEKVQEILQSYDFIGITERMDESLVVLRLLLGLDAGDILYFSAKISGGYDYGCNEIPKKMHIPKLDNYLKSNEWQEMVSYSNLIYKAANISLDLTIQKLGPAFHKAKKEHEYLIFLAKTICENRTIFPCSATGVKQHNESEKHCYHKDFGCGYPCLDELYDNYTKGINIESYF